MITIPPQRGGGPVAPFRAPGIMMALSRSQGRRPPLAIGLGPFQGQENHPGISSFSLYRKLFPARSWGSRCSGSFPGPGHPRRAPSPVVLAKHRSLGPPRLRNRSPRTHGEADPGEFPAGLPIPGARGIGFVFPASEHRQSPYLPFPDRLASASPWVRLVNSLRRKPVRAAPPRARMLASPRPVAGAPAIVTSRPARWLCPGAGVVLQLPQRVDGAEQLAAERGVISPVPIEHRAGVENGPVGQLGLFQLVDRGELLDPHLQPAGAGRDDPAEELPCLLDVGRTVGDLPPGHRGVQGGSRRCACCRQSFQQVLHDPAQIRSQAWKRALSAGS